MTVSEKTKLVKKWCISTPEYSAFIQRVRVEPRAGTSHLAARSQSAITNKKMFITQ